MTNTEIYKDIAARTNGSIFLGVVGPVRTGKSTFINRFMELLVLPNLEGEYLKERAADEMPQSSLGRTIMTTEPKFIPETAAELHLKDGVSCRVRLIDCVGYIVPSSIGYIEGDAPRMVNTPWSQESIPFSQAAEIGTRRVITEHSTVGIAVTTDGSISDIPREEYAEAEERVINELKAINKPFVVLLNSAHPTAETTIRLAAELSEKYAVPVIPVNCLELNEEDITDILTRLLFEFPIKQITVGLPDWISLPEEGQPLRAELLELLQKNLPRLTHLRQLRTLKEELAALGRVESCSIDKIDPAKGEATLFCRFDRELFFEVLSKGLGCEIKSDRGLLKAAAEYKTIKENYMRIKGALDEVEATGYGIVMPCVEELSLEEPEIMRQGGRYGVRLKASAPSLHIMKANITTEVSPIVGSEKQSEDLVMYLLKEFEENPIKIWDSNIFGKSLHELVNEGLHTKLARMPQDARIRIQETVERVINEGCSGLICIIL